MAQKSQASAKKQARPPVVSVLGHIDHGKTSLLDKIRQTRVAASETGGITQHIGAYQAEFKGQKITFIDTPGHAAFAKMRARGAKATDLAILVVAANEGIKPQTKESLRFIREAEIPFLVAANKIDLPGCYLEGLKNSLARENVIVEDRGGEVVFVPVSAKTGEGIDLLLEMILLVSEMQELKGSPDHDFSGIIIESCLDHSRGAVGTVLVKDGLLKIKDEICADNISCRVKAMFDEFGRPLKEAGPSRPVEVLGFAAAPQVGTTVVKGQAAVSVAAPSAVVPSSSADLPEAPKDLLRLIVKADVQGTLEAVLANLPTKVQIISSGVGDFNESDIFLAQASAARLVGFRVKAPGSIKKLAETEKIEIKTYAIIYELFEEIEQIINDLIHPKPKEEILGEAEVLQEFVSSGHRVAGCRLLKGRLVRQDNLRLMRGKKLIGETKAASLQTGKDRADKIQEGEEFGISFTSEIDFHPGDMLLSWRNLPLKK